MSHIATVDIQLRDLDAIKAAAARLGLVFCEGQASYRWYGHRVGDSPLPEGLTEDELGYCEHAITSPTDTGYEIGIVRRKDGQGYQLAFDTWGPGQWITERLGEDMGAFKQAYGVELAKRELQLEGWMVNEVLAADGSIELVATQ